MPIANICINFYSVGLQTCPYVGWDVMIHWMSAMPRTHVWRNQEFFMMSQMLCNTWSWDPSQRCFYQKSAPDPQACCLQRRRPDVSTCPSQWWLPEPIQILGLRKAEYGTPRQGELVNYSSKISRSSNRVSTMARHRLRRNGCLLLRAWQDNQVTTAGCPGGRLTPAASCMAFLLQECFCTAMGTLPSLFLYLTWKFLQLR